MLDEVDAELKDSEKQHVSVLEIYKLPLEEERSTSTATLNKRILLSLMHWRRSSIITSSKLRVILRRFGLLSW